MKIAFKVATLAMAVLSAAPVLADTYPSKPIRLVVPFTPGGTTDNLGRLLGTKLGETLGQSVVVDNRGGAGGTIGMDLVAKAPADGYTLLFGTVGTSSINPSLYKRLPYDSHSDFTPIAPFASVPNILVINPNLPVKNVAELIEYSKKNPNKLNMGSAGSGTTNHLSGEMFKSMTGASMTHVPYKGSGPAMADLLGNQIQVMFDNFPGSLPHVKAGSLRALAVTGSARSSALPDIPTMEEAGVKGYVADVWFGVLAPKNIPPEILKKLSTAITDLSKDKVTIEKLQGQGATPLASTPIAFSQLIQSDTVKWAKIVKDSGATVD